MVPEKFNYLTEKQYDNLPCCDRCHVKMPNNGRAINLTQLTAMASWHRNVFKDRIVLCDDCCRELNEKIDKWLINKGDGVKIKFE